MSLGDYAVIILIIAGVVMAVRSMIKQKKSRSGCSSCNGCSSCTDCSKTEGKAHNIDKDNKQ